MNRSFFLCLAACRTRSSACDTRARSCARCVLCCSAFSLVSGLGSPHSAAGFPALFVGFPATTPKSDFSRPFITGYGSSPSQCGPVRLDAIRPGGRSPRFRRVPCMRDVALDPGRASEPRIAAPHMLPSTDENVSAPATLSLSWLTPTPHLLAAYASPWSSPSTSQHSLPGGRYPLPGPVFHRLDRASLAWRTSP